MWCPCLLQGDFLTVSWSTMLFWGTTHSSSARRNTFRPTFLFCCLCPSILLKQVSDSLQVWPVAHYPKIWSNNTSQSDSEMAGRRETDRHARPVVMKLTRMILFLFWHWDEHQCQADTLSHMCLKIAEWRLPGSQSSSREAKHGRQLACWWY